MQPSLAKLALDFNVQFSDSGSMADLDRTQLNQTRTQIIADAAQRATTYIEGGNTRSIGAPLSAQRTLDELPTTLPEHPRDPAEVLALLDRFGSPATTVQGQGRFFGFVNGGLDPAGQAAAILTGAWDQNAALPIMSPAATHLDAQAARWVIELLGLPDESVATFCGGATVANFTCIVAARDTLLARQGWDVAKQGLQGAPTIRIVTGAETHISVLKSFRLAGFGTDAVTFVPTDDCGRILADQFPDVDALTIVMLQAGNVNTGYSDPFGAIIPRIHAQGGWVHVDGAFGLWTAVSPSRRHAVAGVELADSWATDAHKWLNAPYDSGIAICARRDDLYRAMMIDAPYLATDAARPLMHLSIQMSQGARGAQTWAVIAAQGRAGIVDLIDRTSDHASMFASLLADAGAQVLAPPIINQALIRFDDDDEITNAVIAAAQADGTCWVGGTIWHGLRAMRISVSDMATTAEDIEASAAAIIRCWKSLQ
jgi:glutamate/tyrosine decarboxylase-like PLP-dependent enzyme